MIIKINGHEFNDAQWNVQNGIGFMLYKTNISIVDIISNIGEKNNIEVYDENETLITVWYNSGIININENKDNNGDRYIEVHFGVSILDDNAEAVLQNGIDESVDGIFELAEYINGLDEEHTETRRRIDMYTESVQEVAKNFDNKHADTNEKFLIKDRQITDIVESISKLQTNLTAVQNAIEDIPNDIVKRFADLGNKYDALADRVARLENKEVE